MKPCPYRKEHEFDEEGLCLHCYAEAPHEHWWEAESPNSLSFKCKCGATRTYEEAATLDSSFSIPIKLDQQLKGYYSGVYAPMTQKDLDDAIDAVWKNWRKP